MRDDDRRALELLDLVIRTAGRTRKEVDERARLCRGTTSQLLSGRIQLKYHHILDVLAACETEPRVFFRALHDDLPAAPPSGLSLHEQMIEAARRAGLDPDLDADEPALPAMGKSPGDPGGPQIVVRLEDLVEMVRSRLTGYLAENPQAPPKAHPASVKPGKSGR